MSASAGKGLGETEKDCGTGALNRSGARVEAELWLYEEPTSASPRPHRCAKRCGRGIPTQESQMEERERVDATPGNAGRFGRPQHFERPRSRACRGASLPAEMADANRGGWRAGEQEGLWREQPNLRPDPTRMKTQKVPKWRFAAGEEPGSPARRPPRLILAAARTLRAPFGSLSRSARLPSATSVGKMPTGAGFFHSRLPNAVGACASAAAEDVKFIGVWMDEMDFMDPMDHIDIADGLWGFIRVNRNRFEFAMS